MAEQAAQAAALKAYEDALLLQRRHQPGDDDVSAAQLGAFDPSLLENDGGGLQAVTTGSSQQPLPIPEAIPRQQQVDLLQDLISIQSENLEDHTTAQQLLQQVLEQQRQQNAALAAAEEALQMRPEQHYLTISQDGKYSIVVFCLTESESWQLNICICLQALS